MENIACFLHSADPGSDIPFGMSSGSQATHSINKFPDGRDNPKANVSEVLGPAGRPSHSSSISQLSKGSNSPDWLMHQGPPDTAEIIKTLPQKYRRKLVSQEEIEFIQRGGPE